MAIGAGHEAFRAYSEFSLQPRNLLLAGHSRSQKRRARIGSRVRLPAHPAFRVVEYEWEVLSKRPIPARTRRDYRVTRPGRAECSGKLTERPHCRCYRPTPSTECIHFLGFGDEGMCVRKAEKRAKEKRGRPVRAKSR